MRTAGRSSLNPLSTAALIILAMVAAARARAIPGGGREPIVKAVHYGLDVSVDFDKAAIDAKCRLTVRNPNDSPVDRFTFVLYRLLKVVDIKDERGRAAGFTQQVRAYEDEEDFRANLVEVALPKPLKAGATTTLEILYHGTLEGYVDAGKRYIKDRIDKDFTILRMDCLAYPQPGVASWQKNISAGLPEFDYELAVTVPEGWTVANGGVPVSTSAANGLVTARYRNAKPAWRMDAAIARYQVMGEADRGVRVYHFPEDKAGAGTVFRGLVESLDLFSKRLGPLHDFRGFAVIEVPRGFGSQADVTSILLTKDVFTDGTRSTDLYHEVSHLWSVPARDPLPCRLESEGVAMYLQYWAQEQIDGTPEAMAKGAARQRERFLKSCGENPAAARTPIIGYGKADLTDLAYQKGMLFFYILDRLAGREKLLTALAEGHRRFGAAGATTGDYIDVLKSVLGPEVEPVVKDWIYGTRSSDLLGAELTLDQIAAAYRK